MLKSDMLAAASLLYCAGGIQRTARGKVRSTVMAAGISAAQGGDQIWLRPVYSAPMAGRTMTASHLSRS